MVTTHQQITSAREYLDEVVIPDVADFNSDSASLRKAFHCAGSLFHLHDWVFQDYPLAFPSCKYASDLANHLAAQTPEFLVVKDLANAAKHMRIGSGKSLVHAKASAVQSTGYGEGAFGAGPFGGGPRVRVQTTAGSVEFSLVAKNVLAMWTQPFATNGW